MSDVEKAFKDAGHRNWAEIAVVTVFISIIFLLVHQSDYIAKYFFSLPHKSKAPVPIRSIKLNPELLYFNRIPKSGTENFAFLLTHLAERKNFSHMRYPSPIHRQLKERDQMSHIAQVLKYPRPLAYDRHVYFINVANITAFTLKETDPTWFSMVRDPVAKFISRYFYARDHARTSFRKLVRAKASYAVNTSISEWSRKGLDECVLTRLVISWRKRKRDPECYMIDGEKYDLMIPYFCGHEDECRRLNSAWALAKAKSNIDQYYPVVGVLEQFDDTLKILEKKIPRFFDGIYTLYKEDLLSPHRNRGQHTKRGISHDAIQQLAANMPLEYDLYFYVKARLEKQKKELRIE